MQKEFWNSRYTENESVYGAAPNAFFKAFIDAHQPGTLLLPAEGEGRNALYAAQKGWQVEAFDFSEAAKEKADTAATKNNLSLHYWLQDITQFKAQKKYDAVALIYVHLPEAVRQVFHSEMVNALQPGGYLVLEAFAKQQTGATSGGPKDAAMLYDVSMLQMDFAPLTLHRLKQKEINLDEGSFHQGKAAVVQVIGQKKGNV